MSHRTPPPRRPLRGPFPLGSAMAALAVSALAASLAVAQEAPPAGERPDRAGGARDAEAKPLPTIAAATEGLERCEGLLDLYLDTDRGRVLAVLPAADPETAISLELVHATGLAGGLGSNPIGLDRGQLGDSARVRFLRLGRRVLLERRNLAFRADSDSPRERLAVERSFAGSVIWGGEVAGADPDGRYLVDLTSLLVRDAHGVRETLRRGKHGSFQLDEKRSAVLTARCRTFPRNVELEALLTFAAAEAPGREVRDTAPDPGAFTLTQHLSFVAPPDAGYRPRAAHPRSGFSSVGWQDYAAALDRDLHRAVITRHRLEKLDPSLERSRPRAPIVYHVDPGAPPEILEALIEGASWWRAAFEAAGFVDAFRVEPLPPDADPMDARYHVIHWVHRSTRGWSYGGSIDDPLTGEILKGNVLLGSLRVRQDRLLFEGLLGAEESGSGSPRDPVRIALARIRQLAAHEVGHTLGLTHNFAASTYGGRASVMDYPAPLVRLDETGELDASDAYATGLGAWDLHAIRYGYAEPRPGEDEAALLRRIVADGDARGLRFLTDADARPAGAAHPLANLWDNGDDPVAELGRLLDIRAAAIARFGPRNLPAGAALARLQETFAPLYLHHRYQVAAAAKAIGGVEYGYPTREDAGTEGARATPVPAPTQRAAIDALLACLSPDVLDVPAEVRALLLPTGPGHPRRTERFAGRTAMTFDPLAAAETAADLVLAALLQPERAARLVEQRRHDPALPGVDEVLGRVLDLVLGPPDPAPDRREVQRVVRRVAVDRIARLALDADGSPAVRAAADDALAVAHRVLDQSGEPSAGWLAAEIDLLRRREVVLPPPSTPEPPPGDPIGCGGDPLLPRGD